MGARRRRRFWSRPAFRLISAGKPLRFIHRRTPDADIYFVANPLGQRLAVTPSFRISGRTPELWWPDSGRMEPAAICRKRVGGTQLSFTLEPHGSVFVVFRKVAVAFQAVDLLAQWAAIGVS